MTTDQKPISQPCLRNQDPILEGLRSHFTEAGNVLEIGCGTAQHAVHICKNIPHLTWLPTDLKEHLNGATLWTKESGLENLKLPVELDANKNLWPKGTFDYGYTSNTLHYVDQSTVINIFTGLQKSIKESGILAIYGPFNNNGYTSEGNQNLDQWLKSDINPNAGIKEFSAIVELAKQFGFHLLKNSEMPANNRLLIFSAGSPK